MQNNISALHVASQYGYYKILELLLDAGATVDIQDKVAIILYSAIMLFSVGKIPFSISVYFLYRMKILHLSMLAMPDILV